ncbi:MAG: LysE family transporter [Tateyamaria sp.]|uniref:LysE family transporter n=1 Tax=Tateyamaria sp. TaxID=1929288 RepID=UPI0032887C94
MALSNPKAILILGAFFPHFVVLESCWQSYAMLAAAFLLMEAVAIFAYALAGQFDSNFASEKLPAMQQIPGITMCIFGILLLISPQLSRA